jgi:hypothetical protein
LLAAFFWRAVQELKSKLGGGDESGDAAQLRAERDAVRWGIWARLVEPCFGPTFSLSLFFFCVPPCKFSAVEHAPIS